MIRYRKAALCEVERGLVPKMISTRARGMVRIIDLRDRLHADGGDMTAYAVACRELEAEAEALNSSN